MVQRENPGGALAGNQNDRTRDDIPYVMRNDYNAQIFQDPRPGRIIRDNLKETILKTYKTYKNTITVTINICLVFFFTLFLTKVLSTSCMEESPIGDGTKNVACEPFSPPDKVIVDIDLNVSSHCYSSASCVSLAESLHRTQGKFRYNFIIGAYGFVYIQNGYQCRSEEQENALYMRLPADSIYNGEDFMAAHKAVSKMTELLREGLECGKLRRNYSISARGCGEFTSWCTHVLQGLVSEESPDRESRPRWVYTDTTPQQTPFNPLALSRVYNYQYRLVVCKRIQQM